MANRLTAEQKEKIVSMKKDGKTFFQIADEIDCSIGAIQYTLKKAGLVKARAKQEA